MVDKSRGPMLVVYKTIVFSYKRLSVALLESYGRQFDRCVINVLAVVILYGVNIGSSRLRNEIWYVFA